MNRMIVTLLACTGITACGDTRVQGLLRLDCITGGIRPTVCLATAHDSQHRITQQTLAVGASAVSQLAGPAAVVGGSALIGDGISKSGSRTTVSQTGGGASSTAEGGAGGTGVGGDGGTGGTGGTGGAGGASTAVSVGVGVSP